MIKILFKLHVVNSKTHIVRQAERLKRGEINRRRFIMAALATGVTLPTATSLAQKAEAAHPKRGGALRVGVASKHRRAEMLAMSTGNTLVEAGSDAQLQGDLALNFEATRAGQRWAFGLRRDITFTDGSPLDAHAIVASLSKIETPGLRGQVASLHADGPDTVIFDLIRPNPDFAWVLSDPALAVRNAAGLGTGAYVQTEGARHLQRRDDHWKIGVGHFETIDLISLPDPGARLTALLNGEIDHMDDVDPGMFALFNHSPELRLIETPDAALYGFVRNSSADHGIGRALSDASDRRDLAQKVLLGHGRARGSATGGTRKPVPATISLAPLQDAFPGAREMVSLVTRMVEREGATVSFDAINPQFSVARRRLRPTLDWTLSEILAERSDQTLEALIQKERAAKSADEKAALQEVALMHLESRGHMYPLIANELHAQHTKMALLDAAFDPARIAERAWFA